jgi:hypothetical protein
MGDYGECADDGFGVECEIIPRSLLTENEVYVCVRHTDPLIKGVHVSTAGANFVYCKCSTGDLLQFIANFNDTLICKIWMR